MAKRLSKKETQTLLNQMHEAASGGAATWDPWCSTQGSQRATLCMPSGELLNERIRGFVWGWHARNAIEDGHRIPANASLVANGLEGLIKVHTDLNVALIVLDDVTRDRAYIEIP
jgi:hypothetical protein